MSPAKVSFLLLVASVVSISGAAAQGREYFVSNNGDDNNPGTSSQPWKTVKQSVRRLRAGDTLNLRGGRYFEHGISIGVSGNPGSPITIRAYPGETAVIDGGYREFRSRGNRDWEIYDANRSIYRSVRTYSGASSAHGYFGPDNGSFRLVSYRSYDPFSTDNEDYNNARPYYYIGPGVYWDSGDKRIYVRLKHSKYEAPMGYNVPANSDPRQTPMFLFPRGEVINIERNIGHVNIENLQLAHRPTPLQIRSGAHHIKVSGCLIRGEQYQMLIRNGAHHILLDRLSIADGVPPWIAWTDVKMPASGRPGHSFQGAGVLLDEAVDEVEIRFCMFSQLFDAIDATEQPSNLHVHHNFFATIRDDVLQLGSGGWNIEFNHNLIANAYTSVSWHGSGQPPSSHVGTKYIHHNIIDTSTPQLIGRTDPHGRLPNKFDGINGDGLGAGPAFAIHEWNAISGPDPWKIYHNTIRVMHDVDNGGIGSYPVDRFDPNHPHEVYNNIFQQVSDSSIIRGGRVNDGSQILDGNLYFRSAKSPRVPVFLELKYGGSRSSFASLAAFKSSSYWNATRSYYPAGWESSGVEGDPLLDWALRPYWQGPAATGAVDLSGKGWPGIGRERQRGAVGPRL